MSSVTFTYIAIVLTIFIVVMAVVCLADNWGKMTDAAEMLRHKQLFSEKPEDENLNTYCRGIPYLNKGKESQRYCHYGNREVILFGNGDMQIPGKKYLRTGLMGFPWLYNKALRKQILETVKEHEHE